ncbi:unknown [Tropheryma whipplei str. Twist]|uniref:Uncharacterized protein n=1 Tax=Tropheryma whipplei (strain Twist) TaxID=203267 RepID=Q83GS6_TROWT|nr:unknown [Tropheryma whipplei str. Twist]
MHCDCGVVITVCLGTSSREWNIESVHRFVYRSGCLCTCVHYWVLRGQAFTGGQCPAVF